MLEGTTALPRTPSPFVDAPQGAAQSMLKLPLPAAVRRATKNMVDEAIALKPLAGATRTHECSLPVALAETTSPACKPPPGLGAFDSDDDQDTEDLGEILGSLAEDSLPELDDIMTAPDDDENPELAPLNTADVPANRDEPLAAPKQEIPMPCSSIPLWLIDNYQDLCEHL